MRKFELKRTIKFKETESIYISADTYLIDNGRVTFLERANNFQVNNVGSFEIENDNIVAYEITSTLAPFDQEVEKDLTEML